MRSNSSTTTGAVTMTALLPIPRAQATTAVAYQRRGCDDVAPRRPEVDLDEFPTRLQRPGAVVLEIDDEDPVFEHLEEMAYSGSGYGMTGGMSGDLPRASGQ